MGRRLGLVEVEEVEEGLGGRKMEMVELKGKGKERGRSMGPVDDKWRVMEGGLRRGQEGRGGRRWRYRS